MQEPELLELLCSCEWADVNRPELTVNGDGEARPLWQLVGGILLPLTSKRGGKAQA